MATNDGGPLKRTRSRSTDHTERLEPQLLRAAESDNVDKLRDLIEGARAKRTLQEHHLRIALMRSSEKGKAATTSYLLDEGAPPDGTAGNRLSPLLRAVERNHPAIVHLLLEHGATPETRDKKGRTALMTAAWKNHWHILNSLIHKGADVNGKDLKLRNVLHNLAADTVMDWGDSVIELLLEQDIHIDGPDGQDSLRRTPLHWASATGKKGLVTQLLTRTRKPKASISAVDNREKTALHHATTHGKEDIIPILLSYGANIHARSDGGWTPLHNACKLGSDKIVQILIDAGADVNAKLLNGMSCLHLAAEGGHLTVVQRLLACKEIKRSARDTFGSTPFLRAAQNKHKDIVSLLAPYNNLNSLSEDALGACNGFTARIVDFGNFHNENRVTKASIFELLYGKDPINPRKPKTTIHPTDKAAVFRWIHLPANNMAWVEALLTKLFIEEGAHDIEGFKALEKSFTHQHKGQQSHSHFMRPLCQSTPRAPKVAEPEPAVPKEDPGPPTITVNGAPNQNSPGPRTPSRVSTSASGDDLSEWLRQSSGSGKDHGKGKENQKDKSKKHAKGSKSPKLGTETPTKDHRKTNYLHQRGNSRSLASIGRKETTISHVSKGNFFVFMPYCHYETSERCQEMKQAIKMAETLRSPYCRALQKAKTYDEMLIRAHLATSNVSLHVRRTLDQSFYHNIDTYYRDQDQVVYRYQTKGKDPDDCPEPKIMMVDQLWMWVLGKDLVVTAFPERWQQPRNDPLNVLDSIIEDINDKTRDPVSSVYDLAMIITNRCSAVFDRHRMGDEDYQFLDMFESSIGNATDRETILFKQFNSASAQASAWLRHHRRLNSPSMARQVAHDHDIRERDMKALGENYNFDDFTRGPVFIDRLLDIGEETDLLAETKDIRDELNMIKKVLDDQASVLPSLELAILDIFKEEQKSQQEVKRRFADQLKAITVRLKDIDRMDRQAERIYASITDMLDLKQKHANAFEARFARDQATSTARQSQTIMVFTIVTIIFLPMSFIAAFFAINIREFPHDNGNASLPLGYVSKYMFGIGLSISIPMIFIAFYLDDIGEFLRKPSALEILKIEKVLSGGRSLRKSADTEWIRERLSVTGRPLSQDTRGDVSELSMGVAIGGGGGMPMRQVTGFRMRASNDIERGLR
ncbi:ankyrin [Tricladium varicosporioides]|nr:ankyrin [Hymenoscyphus varicosporioides]